VIRKLSHGFHALVTRLSLLRSASQALSLKSNRARRRAPAGGLRFPALRCVRRSDDPGPSGAPQTRLRRAERHSRRLPPGPGDAHPALQPQDPVAGRARTR